MFTIVKHGWRACYTVRWDLEDQAGVWLGEGGAGAGGERRAMFFRVFLAQHLGATNETYSVRHQQRDGFQGENNNTG